MRYNIKQLAFVLFVLVLFSNCTAFQTMTVEVAQQPRVPVPTRIQSLCFMDRSLTPTHSTFTAKELQTIFDSQIKANQASVLDSVTSDSTLLVLSDMMFNNQLFDVVVPTNRVLEGNKTTKALPKPLSTKEVIDICTTYDTDGLFVLEYLMPKVQQRKYITPFKLYYQSIDMEYKAYYRIYDGKTGEALQRSLKTGTFFYEAEGKTVQEVEKKLPSLLEATRQAGFVCAEDIIKDLTPTWKTEDRFYFTFDEETNKKAGLYIDNQQWEELSNLYQNRLERAKKSNKSKLEHNIALTYELNGNIPKAIEWSTASYKTKYRNNTAEYLNYLIEYQKRSDLSLN